MNTPLLWYNIYLTHRRRGTCTCTVCKCYRKTG